MTGITINLNVSDGSVVIYGSDKTQTPNEAFYDFKLTRNQPALFISFDRSSNSIVVRRETTNATDTTVNLAIQGLGASSNFALNTTMGDTTPAACTTNTGILTHACPHITFKIMYHFELFLYRYTNHFV